MILPRAARSSDSFRTVRENFLVDIREDQAWDIKTLNDAFVRWLREHYHHGHHRGIDARPIDRYQISIREYPRKRVAEETLDEFFLGHRATGGQQGLHRLDARDLLRSSAAIHRQEESS